MRHALGFERQVALRFLLEGRMQTLLIIVGVAAGVAVVAYISALITGLQRNTLEKTLGAQAHVSLSVRDDVVLPAAELTAGSTALVQTQPRAQRLRSMANWQALVPLLEALPGVAAVSPMVAGAGLALRGEASRSIALVGVDLDRYDRIVQLRSKVVAGTARLGPGEGIMGRELAEDLGVSVGDRVGLVTGAVGDSLRVTALVDLGVRELNRRTVIVPLRSAQSLARPARRRHQPRPGAGRCLDRAGAGRGPGPPLALQGGELAADQCAAGVGAERAVDQHHADPRRGHGRGGAGHRQRAGGVGGAKAARDRHPARHGRHAAAGAAHLLAAGRDRRRRRLRPGRAAGSRADLGLHHLRARLGRAATVRHHAGAVAGVAGRCHRHVCGVLAAVAPARRAAALDPAAAIRL
jgi:hypothetical protein